MRTKGQIQRCGWWWLVMVVDQNRLALAAIAACAIRAFGDRDPEFLERFREQLDQADELLRGNGPEHFGAVETLVWVRELIDALAEPESSPAERSGTSVAAE